MGVLFGTDGVRGRANEYPMTAEMAIRIGRATAHLFKQRGARARIIVGRDTRISGPMLESAVIAGICAMGADALVLGVIPTPGVAHLITTIRADAGIVISASHNPFQDNGIKIFSRDGFKLPDKWEREIEELVLSDGRDTLHSSSQDLGSVYRIEDAMDRYSEFLKGRFPAGYTLEGLTVVLDCAHGATYRVAPETFLALGAEVTSLFDEPNGVNINAGCGSQHPEALAEEVVRRGADVGFSFDGDGDRLVAVDEKGVVLTGDQVLAICASQLKKEGRLANNVVVSTVMSNIGLRRALEGLAIKHAVTTVGDRSVVKAMQARGACIGGEESGHLIFLHHHTTGDGIMTALQVMAAMKKDQKALSELATIMKVYPQTLINVEVKSKPDISSIPEVVKVIRMVERELGNKGRVFVRYSGTQDMCRVMVEGPTVEETEQYCRQIAEVIRAALG